jgi:Na+-translocating ferredoxin:NAD+ oxidoreductase subunit D
MNENPKKWILSNPPHRLVPESSQHIMRVTTATLLLPILAAGCFFGCQALKLILIAALAAVFTEWIFNALKHENISGSVSHSLAMGLIFAFTLPAACPWTIALIGSVAGILIGKHFFGGLGHYLWHPALIGRLIVQLFFKNQISPETGPLLLPAKMFTGNIKDITTATDWFSFNWFAGSKISDAAGYLLPQPLEPLRNFSDLHFLDTIPQFQQYLLDKLPSLSHCVIGAVPGPLGETSAIAVILVGLYLFYRGYLNWQFSLTFLAAAYLAALLLPIRVDHPDISIHFIYWPVIAENPAAGFTLANYQLFNGSLLFCACIIGADMTSRPITIRGQILFAAATGLLAMIFRLYTPIAIPSYAAILAMNSFVPTIDRFTRPHARPSRYQKH